MVAAEWRRTHVEPRHPRVRRRDGGDRWPAAAAVQPGRTGRARWHQRLQRSPTTGAVGIRRFACGSAVAGPAAEDIAVAKIDTRPDAMRAGRGSRPHLDQLVLAERGGGHRSGDERGRDNARRAGRPVWRHRRVRFRVGERRDPDRGPHRPRERRDPRRRSISRARSTTSRPARTRSGQPTGRTARSSESIPRRNEIAATYEARDECRWVPDRRRRDLGRRRPERRGRPGRPRGWFGRRDDQGRHTPELDRAGRGCSLGREHPRRDGHEDRPRRRTRSSASTRSVRTRSTWPSSTGACGSPTAGPRR